MIIRTIDFETTGTEPPAEVIEAGWCDVRYDTAKMLWLVDLPASVMHASDRITAETRAIHHISPAEVRGWEPFDARQLILQSAVAGVTAFAAHHADFEAKWLGPFPPDMPIVCTYKAALRVWPDLPSHSNQFLRYWLEEQGLARIHPDLARPAHRAGPDAYATAHLLAVLLRRVTLEDLVAWTAEPALLPRIPIGKQRGAKWSEVQEGFLHWMLNQATMEADLKWNAKRELDRRARAGRLQPEGELFPEPGDK